MKIYVDAVDFVLINLCKKNDIDINQDYGCYDEVGLKRRFIKKFIGRKDKYLE